MLGDVHGVQEICVLGRPSDDWGQEVVAVVVPQEDLDLAALEQDLERVARARLSPFARPKSYRFRRSLPLLPSGKHDRRGLANELAAAVSAE